MNRIISIFAVLTVGLVTVASAQDDRPPGEFRGRRGGERLQQFKQLRLMEELKLGEEESVRFFARQRAHEEKIRGLMKERNELIALMDSLLDASHEATELQRLSGQIMDIDAKIFRQRDQFFRDQQKALTPGQFAAFLVFEWKFGRQVRDAMGDNFRKRHRTAPDEMEE